MHGIALLARDVWSRKRRLAGMALAVVLGVAFLSATLILGDTTRAGMLEVLEAANAGTDVVVRSEDRIEGEEDLQQGLLDAALAGELAAIDGVEVAVPTVDGIGQVLAADGTPIGGDGPPTIASGWLDDERLLPFTLVEGRQPSGPGEVVVDEQTAEAGDLAVGDVTAVLVPEPVEVTVVGIAEFRRAGGMAGATFVAFDDDVAAEVLLGQPGRATGIAVVAAGGVDPAELADRIAAALPDGLEAITADELVAEQQQALEEDFLDFLELFLLVFAGVALLVAATSVHNTATVLAAQRTREAALLRAVGATRRQVLAAGLTESALVGLAAGAVGAGLGVGLAAGLDALLGAAGFGPDVGGLVVVGGSIVWPIAIGAALTVAAGLAPAARASRTAPVAAMRAVDTEDGRPPRWRTALGAVLVLNGAAGIVGAERSSSAMAAAGLGALLLVVGVVLLAPAIARAAAGVLGAPLRAAGITGRLAVDGARRNPRRTAGTASALFVGVGVVTAFTVLADSIASSVEEEVDRRFAGDLVVQSGSWGGAGLGLGLADDLQDLDEVAAAVPLGDALVLLDGKEASVTVSDAAALDRVFDTGLAGGDLAAAAAGGLAVSADEAGERGWALGDVVTVRFATGGEVALPVAAVFEEETAVGGIVLPLAAWVEHATQPRLHTVLVDLADGVDLEAGRRAVEAAAAPYGAPEVMDREEYVDLVAGEVDQVLGLVYGLLGLAIVIALLGIAGTLSLSVHERTREFGLLRAVGTTRRQLRAIVRGEAVVVSLFGTALGIAVGTFSAWGLVRAAGAEEGLGTFTVPGGQLAVVLALGAVAGVVAAVRPARRAARLPVLASIAAG